MEERVILNRFPPFITGVLRGSMGFSWDVLGQNSEPQPSTGETQERHE